MTDLDFILLYISIVLVTVAGLIIFFMRKNVKGKPKKPDKKKEKAIKDLEKIKDESKPPDGIPPPPPPNQSTTALQQYDVPASIQIELTRLKEEPNGNKRATTKRGRVTLIPRFQGNKDLFFFWIGKRGYFIDPSKIIDVYTTKGFRNKKQIVTDKKLVYDVFNTEPLDSTGKLEWSWDVESLLRDSVMDQYITVATFEGGFQLTTTLMRAILVVGVLGAFLGLAINGTYGLTPKEIIHFVP